MARWIGDPTVVDVFDRIGRSWPVRVLGESLTVNVDAKLTAEDSDNAPAQSTTVIVFDMTGAKVKKVYDSVAQAQAGQAPQSQ